jgi:hypothetical protein
VGCGDSGGNAARMDGHDPGDREPGDALARPDRVGDPPAGRSAGPTGDPPASRGAAPTGDPPPDPDRRSGCGSARVHRSRRGSSRGQPGAARAVPSSAGHRTARHQRAGDGTCSLAARRLRPLRPAQPSGASRVRRTGPNHRTTSQNRAGDPALPSVGERTTGWRRPAADRAGLRSPGQGAARPS